MDCVLVGVDGSGAARDALAWSADLALRLQAELVAVRVFTPTQAELSPDIDAALHAEQRSELEHWCNSLPSGGRRARAILVDGDPADALLAAAADAPADLIVVGGAGTSGPSHVRPGSAVEKLTQYTTVPLAIVSNGDATPLQHVVLGVDGSDGSGAAVAFVAEFACRLGVGVTAVHAFERLIDWVPDSDARSARHESEVAVRHWIAPIVRAGVDVELDIDRDIDPVPAIARALDVHAGSAGVVGTHRLSEVSGMRLGRLPLRLVHHTAMPVIVVPTPQT
jgi:nucleotide-binding universal stress UspA family protein